MGAYKMNVCPGLKFTARYVLSSLSIVLILFLFASTSSGQGIATGSLSGTITDPSGAVLPGAHLVAKNVATGQEFSADSNDVGYVALRSVPPGTYKVTVSLANFRTVVLDNIEVTSSRDSNLGSVKLELGAVGETVQVEGAPPLVESTT
jgi:Carboxypeptidase regulatory-like domain